MTGTFERRWLAWRREMNFVGYEMLATSDPEETARLEIKAAEIQAREPKR